MKHPPARARTLSMVAALVASVLAARGGAQEARIPVSSATTPGDADSTYQIQKSGSYYFASNLKGEAGKSGIEITASDVTLDLNGFALIGVPGSLGGVVVVEYAATGLVVRNGAISGFGGHGVSVAHTNRGLAARDLRVSGNAGTGINAGKGSIEGCTALENAQNGFQVSSEASVADSHAESNGLDGLVGMVGVVVRGCHFTQNGGRGLAVLYSSVVDACSASYNTGTGMEINSALATDCMSHSNDGDGFSSPSGGSFYRCRANNNRFDGFRVGLRSRVVDCRAESNGFNGDGAGIHATNGLAHLDGNFVASNDRGIELDGSRSFVVRNVAHSNAVNYDLGVTLQTIGPIITEVGPITTTSPWANFSQ